MQKKLVIFDLDGVIADSEKIWLKVRQESLNEKFGMNWNFQTVNEYLGGMSDKSKRIFLDNMGYVTDDFFWQEQLKKDIDVMIRNGLEVFDGVEDLIKKVSKKCIATGGVKNKTVVKLEVIGFWNKYFNDDNVFTSDMVQNGKPAPDIYLYALDKMGENKEDCIVIEDSIVGMTAALSAGIECIAFLGCDIYKNDEYIEKVRNLGIKHICFNMKEVEKIIFS